MYNITAQAIKLDNGKERIVAGNAHNLVVVRKASQPGVWTHVVVYNVRRQDYITQVYKPSKSAGAAERMVPSPVYPGDTVLGGKQIIVIERELEQTGQDDTVAQDAPSTTSTGGKIRVRKIYRHVARFPGDTAPHPECITRWELHVDGESLCDWRGPIDFANRADAVEAAAEIERRDRDTRERFPEDIPF